MGCYCSVFITNGEDYIQDTIESMKMWEYTYPEMKEYLVNLSVENKIHLNTVREFIMEPFTKTDDHTPIRDLILSQLEEFGSFYSVLFYLFPFMKSTEIQTEHFVEILTKLNKHHGVESPSKDLILGLRKYYEFVLVAITRKMRQRVADTLTECENRNNKLQELDDFINYTFSAANIDKEIERVEKLMNMCQEQELSRKFNYACKNYVGLIFNYRHLREFFIVKYGSGEK
jgi:hypothetical protein